MKKVFLIGITSLLLTGCSIIIDFGDFLSMPFNSSKQSTSEKVIISGNYQNKGLTGQEYLDYYSKVSDCKYLPQDGNPKMLVVPVLFKGVSSNSLIKSSSTVLNDLEKVFNGDESSTGWESVNSYYQKSSYGKLDMDIDVYQDWITLDKTINQIASLDPNYYADPTWYVVDYVLNYLSNENFDLTQYDMDDDGFIDGIWIVYGSRNYTNLSYCSPEEENLLWAYTYWQYNNTPNIVNPKANVYCWGSYDFMYESVNASSSSKITLDAHTFIHETGHMLGLDDYYDYDNTSNPTGCLDMMDYNIGDHNAFSKYLLGWVEPQVFDFEEGVYTLRPFESSGDCLIIPAMRNVNSSPLGEYLILEYYTPTGLNEMDANYNYLKSYPKMFTKNGLKIYHVDARLGELVYNYNNWKSNGFIYNYSKEMLESNTLNNKYYTIMSSNTPSYSYTEGYKLLTLLSDYYKDGHLYHESYAENHDLFTNGSFLDGFTFNSGEMFDFKLEIDNISNDEIRIYIGGR